MPPAKIDPARLKELIEVEQVTQVAAAVRLGCSKSCVERTCKRLGLQTQRTGPRSGPLHPDWKGGRIVVGNYWYIWTNTHPHRTSNNYMAEHRLVAEATIGRYLLREEVVHHINGDSQDNRPANLAVFGTNAEHLRHELTGRIPNWTPEGWAAMQAGCRKTRTRRLPALPDAVAHTQTTDHLRTTAVRTVRPAS